MEEENGRQGDSLTSCLLPLVPCGISPSSRNELSHSLKEAAVFEDALLSQSVKKTPDQAVVFILITKYKLSGQVVCYSDVRSSCSEVHSLSIAFPC